MPLNLSGQSAAPPDSGAVKIPLSDGIRRAYATGTRDSTGAPGPNYWQIRVAYDLHARLDVDSSMVRGRGSARLHNTSPDTLGSIQLRLDQNRFRRNPTRSDAESPVTSGMTVTRLAVDGRTAAIAPEGTDRRPYLSDTRRTSETVGLSEPVAPGGTVTLAFDWHFEVPLDDEGRALRMGRWSTDVYQVAQWYPRIAMYDDLNGWDTSTYEGPREFYNPYGRFEVSLDVPAGWLVGATGVLQNPAEVLSPRTRTRLQRLGRSDTVVTIVGPGEQGSGEATREGDRLVWRFSADSVSDFAWGASPGYRWDAVRIDLPSGRSIPGHMLFTSRRSEAYARAREVLRRDLAFNSALVMPYAFPQHTLLDGPEGGMEYPMLTMSDGTRLGHELWHQWYPIMVGSNEKWYAFMDEGLANFLADLADSVRSGTQWHCSPEWDGPEMRAPLLWPDGRGAPAVSTTLYGYGLPTHMFCALSQRFGQDAVLEALAAYSGAWRFRHPSPWDFMFSVSRVLEADLDRFWYRWLFTVR